MKPACLHPSSKIMMPVSQWVCDCIRRRRLALGLTQEDLAGRSGVTVMCINHLECGRRSVKLETVERICEGLDISVTELLAEAQRRSALTRRF
jgi:transcriptional regulator with XRE-family HTH domain